MTSQELEELRQAVADYIGSEGCSCCQNREAHALHTERLGKLLNVPRYSDDSGYAFHLFRSGQVKP